MAKIKLDRELYDRAAKVADTAGYASVDEFISHVLEKELRNITGGDGDPADEEKLKERLRGLGYIS